MFSHTADAAELRQGDIVQGLYYPQLNCETLPLLGVAPPDAGPHVEGLSLAASARTQSGMAWLTAQVSVHRGYSMVLSPCCDLERRGGKLEVPAIVVAPLLQVAYNIRNDASAMAVFRQNPLDDYTGMYFVAQHPPLDGEYMVDFCRAVSIPRGEYPHTRRGKVLQLDDAERVKFKTKLGLYFGRPTAEEIAAGLIPGVPVQP